MLSADEYYSGLGFQPLEEAVDKSKTRNKVINISVRRTCGKLD
jgi:hypothetical protein